MKKIALTACSAAAILFSGCAPSVASFDRSEFSAISNNISEVELLKSCDFSGEKIAPGALPLYAAGGKLIFDLIMEDRKTKLKGLKDASVVSYSNQVIVSPDKFKEAKCVRLTRSSGNETGITSVLKINHYDDTGFTLTPIHVRAKNTAAITKNPEENKDAKINVSYAVSVKAVGINRDSGLPTQYLLGSGITTVSDVSVSPDADSSCPKGCKESDLIPVVALGNHVAMTFAVTESGKLGINVDKRTAQIDAVKEAMGPAFSAAITAKYADD